MGACTGICLCGRRYDPYLVFILNRHFRVNPTAVSFQPSAKPLKSINRLTAESSVHKPEIYGRALFHLDALHLLLIPYHKLAVT
jgi:hypothetical protein